MTFEVHDFCWNVCGLTEKVILQVGQSSATIIFYYCNNFLLESSQRRNSRSRPALMKCTHIFHQIIINWVDQNTNVERQRTSIKWIHFSPFDVYHVSLIINCLLLSVFLSKRTSFYDTELIFPLHSNRIWSNKLIKSIIKNAWVRRRRDVSCHQLLRVYFDLWYFGLTKWINR